MAIQLNPKDAVVFYNRGNAKRDLGNSEGAIQDYDRAIELKPDFAFALYNRGIAKKKLGDLRVANLDLLEYRKLKNNSEIAKTNMDNRVGDKAY